VTRRADPTSVTGELTSGCSRERNGRGDRRRERVELRVRTLVLIKHGERHEIRNTGDTRLETLHLYVPPAHTEDGDELPAGKS
jgi:mannose-6-phosphate isomerase-like protein (cupin superfamily)